MHVSVGGLLAVLGADTKFLEIKGVILVPLNTKTRLARRETRRARRNSRGAAPKSVPAWTPPLLCGDDDAEGSHDKTTIVD